MLVAFHKDSTMIFNFQGKNLMTGKRLLEKSLTKEVRMFVNLLEGKTSFSKKKKRGFPVSCLDGVKKSTASG